MASASRCEVPRRNVSGDSVESCGSIAVFARNAWDPRRQGWSPSSDLYGRGEAGFHAEVWVNAGEAFPHIHERFRDVLRTRVSLWFRAIAPALRCVLTLRSGAG